MKRVLTLFVSLSFICSSSFAPAQAGAPPQPHAQVSDLIDQGHLDLAIAVLEAEVEAPNRTDAQRGRAAALLGYAYEQEGKLTDAQRSFDRAFRLMDAARDRSTDYAATLDIYAGLLMAMGDLEAASKALHEAAVFDSRLSNHAELARVYSHTAEVEIERKKYKRAKETLASARTQALLARESGNSIFPEIDATSGWLAISMGKVHEGAADYSTALEECRQQFGEKNATTGWTYLLLGKAEELDHDLAGAARSMDKGLAILKETVGPSNIRYLAGELAYSELLDHSGAHAEAVRIGATANQSLRSLGLTQCAGCTVSVWSLRHKGGQ